MDFETCSFLLTHVQRMSGGNTKLKYRLIQLLASNHLQLNMVTILNMREKKKEASQCYNFVDENNENLNLESILCYFDFIIVNSLGDIYSKWLYYILGS